MHTVHVTEFFLKNIKQKKILLFLYSLQVAQAVVGSKEDLVLSLVNDPGLIQHTRC
jgi:hypothetical protein